MYSSSSLLDTFFQKDTVRHSVKRFFEIQNDHVYQMFYPLTKVRTERPKIYPLYKPLTLADGVLHVISIDQLFLQEKNESLIIKVNKYSSVILTQWDHHGKNSNEFKVFHSETKTQ